MKTTTAIAILIFGLSLWASDPVHIPAAKTTPPGTVDIDVQGEASWFRENSKLFQTDFATVSVSYGLIKRLEVDADLLAGRTVNQGHSVFNPANFSLGAKYRLMRRSYEGGEFIVSVGYKTNLPSRRYLSLMDLGVDQIGAAYLGLAQGLNHRGQLLMFASQGKLIASGYGEYNRRGSQDYLKLGNEAKVGGSVEYTLTKISKTPQLSFVLDSWFKHSSQASKNGYTIPETGGNELWLAPGIVVGLTPRMSIKAAFHTPMFQHMGSLSPTGKNGFLVGIAYRH